MPNDGSGAFLTLFEALSLPVFKDSRVAGGNSGINRPVSGVNITDIPDYYNWIHAGELLVTNCFGIKDDEKALADFIPTLHKHRLAGVCIKPHRFIDEITPEMISCADELGFPIIELAADVNFIDITKALFDALLKATENVRRNDFLLHLFNDAITDERREITKAKSYGLNLEHKHMVVRQIISQKQDQSGEDSRALQKTLLSSELNRLMQSLGVPSVTAHDGDEELVILSAPPESKAFPNTRRKLEATVSSLSKRYTELLLYLGCGLPHTGLAGLKQSGNESKTALRVSMATKINVGGLLSFDDIGLFRLIFATDPNSEIRAYINETIGPLINMSKTRNVEFIPMLEAYFRYNGNLKKLSEATFTHYNTVVYRLRRVKELTGLDPRKADDRFRLETALNLYRLVEPEGERE